MSGLYYRFKMTGGRLKVDLQGHYFLTQKEVCDWNALSEGGRSRQQLATFKRYSDRHMNRQGTDG